MSATIDYTHVVPGRRLVATFYPQEWIHDDAVSSGPSVDVDVTDHYLTLSPEDRAKVQDYDQSADDLILETMGGSWPKGHTGPGYVLVEDEIAEFHEAEIGE